MKNHSSRLLAVSIATCIASVAAAQSAATAPDQATPVAGLEEIVVTAQRREETLQHAAIAVTAVAGSQLQDTGTVKVEELTQLVPALQVAAAAGPYPLFYVRGVGNFNGNSLSDSALAINQDGVYLARPSSASGLFYDVNRLEVLKGPQGTLYGRNATGGAVNVVVNRPTDEFSGEVVGEFGNYSTKNFSGYLNVPFNDVVKSRLSLQSMEHSGYMRDGTDDEYGRAARLQVLITPNDRLSINLDGDFFHQGGKGVGASLLVPGGFAGGDPRASVTSPAASAIYSSTFYFPAGNVLGPVLTQTAVVPPGQTNIQQDNDYWGINATVDWKTDIGTLTVIPAYRHSKLDYVSAAPGFLIVQQEADKQGSFEARFASNTDQALSYLAGIYYLNERIDVPTAIFDQEYNQSTQAFKPATDSYAGFGRITYTVLDGLRLNAGVRYTQDHKYMDGLLTSTSTLCPTAFIPPPAGPIFCFGGVGQVTVPSTPINQHVSDSWGETTWRAGVDYDLTSKSLLYAAVETGFKAGGFFFTHDDPVYQPEKIIAYTVGSKNRFFDNSLQLNAELFYWIYKDQQISHIVQDSTGTVVFATDNVGKAKMKGFELDAQYLLVRGTVLTADLQYLDAVYDNYTYLYPNLGAPPTTDCPVALTTTGASYAVNCSGRTPPQSPRWTTNLGLQETLDVGYGSVVGTINTHFQTKTLTGLEFSDLETQPGYWWTDATLGYRAPQDHWSVTGYVNNLADRTVIQGSFAGPLGGAALTAATIRPPRTYGIRLSAKF